MSSTEVLPHEIVHGRDEAMLSQDLWTEIRLMSKMGKPIKVIARELNISKNTVKKALRQEQYQPYQRGKPKPNLLSEFMPFLLERSPQVGFNATTLYRELKGKGYAGGYTLVKEAIRPLRETHRQIEAATVRFETPPGFQAQMDWGTKQIYLGGNLVRIHIFVLVLGYSRACYVEFTLDEKLPTLIACHERAFRWFGGVPEEILYDNPKTIVLERGTSNARINPKFEDFCRYYGYTPRLCRPYRAKTKGKVESGVKYVKRSFLPGQEFSSLVAANEQVWHWVQHVADQRIHGTVHEKPAERFLRENLHSVLGKPPYLLEACQLRKVATDCLVSYQASRYSVPWRYVNQIVDIQDRSNGRLYIYHKGSLIAQHQKSERKHQVVMETEHYRDLLKRPVQKETLNIFLTTPQPDVQIRSLQVYESLATGGVLHG
jgi:transposase